MKKMWNNPLLTVNKIEGSSTGGWTGDGSGDTTIDFDDIPWDYEMWLVLGEDLIDLDVDGDGDAGTWADYRKWMIDHHFEDPGEVQP